MLSMESQPVGAAQRYWATRHEVVGENWAVAYYNAFGQPHRQVLLEAVAAFQPRSVLEIGCNAGPNLRLIRERLPQADLHGWDVNSEAIAYARRAFRGDHRTSLHCGTFSEALRAPRLFDVVVSCYALAYASPEDVTWILALMLSRARNAVVLAEPMTTGASHMVAEIPEYAHNYAARVALLGAPWRVTRLQAIEPPADRLNGLLVLEPITA